MSNPSMTTNAAAGAEGVATRETGDLISAGKVDGTVVYNRQGTKLGTVHDVMIDKRSGQVSYAVLSFGGFLGIGENYFPLPWNQLTYDTTEGGYVVDIDEARLKGAPSYAGNQTMDWEDRDYRRTVDDYYGVPPAGMAGMPR